MGEKTGWIDFKQLRSQLYPLSVLRQYNVKITVKGERATGFCPLSTHQGQRRSPSFSMNLERGIWQCFGCHAKGNVLDFAARMEGFNPDNPKELRQAALKIVDVFKFGHGTSPGPTSQTASRPSGAPTPSGKSVVVNAPIDFELRTLDPDHPYLKERGFTPETIRHFGLGFCNRGRLRGRLAIPLHDPQGRLVGYAGRITQDKLISETCPKYLFLGGRERDGTMLEFRKSLLLYNTHRVNGPVDHLFIVEGFPSTWWLWQAQYRNVVALMGSSCSEEQAKLIVDLVKPDGKVWLMPDGNESGVRCAESLMFHVSPHRFCRWVRLGENEQPTNYAVDDLVAVMGTI
jgi:DNA primase